MRSELRCWWWKGTSAMNCGSTMGGIMLCLDEFPGTERHLIHLSGAAKRLLGTFSRNRDNRRSRIDWNHCKDIVKSEAQPIGPPRRMSKKMLERGNNGLSEMENNHHMQGSSWALGFFYHPCDWLVAPVSGYEYVSGFSINYPCDLHFTYVRLFTYTNP